jgi:hypothetical protein
MGEAMSTTNIIIGIVIGLLLGGVALVWRQRYRDVFGALLVLGIAALAVAVTMYQVEQYRDEKSAVQTSAGAEPATPSADGPSGPPPRPLVNIPSPPPLMRGPTGSAAPPAVENPYAGESR